MKKTAILLLAACLSLSLWGCANRAEPAVTEAETTAVSTELPTAPVETTEVTEAAETIAETTAPVPTERKLGPEQMEGTAFIIRDVSVDFLAQLPGSVTSCSSYSFCGYREELVLNDSQVYAAIRFTVTNQGSGEVKLSSIQDEFLVELVYDDNFVYTTASDSHSVFQAGAQDAIVSDNFSIGKVTLAPLATADVTVYIPCARVVCDQTDKHLVVNFVSDFSGYENYEFVIR